MESKVLIIGYYGANNVGDELFVESFNHILPGQRLEFTNFATAEDCQSADLIIFGGGSFLDGAPMVESLASLEGKKIFYCGVGAETAIHPSHVELMKRAEGLFVRSSFLKACEINQRCWLVPDLVYSIPLTNQSKEKNHAVLWMPNALLIPKYKDPSWKATAWYQFKSEAAQVIEVLNQNSYRVDFLAMCENDEVDDAFAAAEILSMMHEKKKSSIISPKGMTSIDLLNFISSYSFVISQRLHGIILAQKLAIPYLNIHHHDKFKSLMPSGGNVNYYEASKDAVLSNFFYQRDKESSVKYSLQDFLPMRNMILEALNR